MNFTTDNEKSAGKNVTGITIVILLHLLVAYGIVTGLGKRLVSKMIAPVETKHPFSVPAKREAQNRKGHVAYWGKYRYRNFARYSAPRFSASW